MTREFLSNCKAAGACRKGLDWVANHLGEPYSTLPADWALWAIGNLPPQQVPPELLACLEQCAKRDPTGALLYAASLLPPKLLEYCAGERPAAALVYTASLLPPKLLEYCVQQEPWMALKYVASLLPPELLKYCAKREPRAALDYAADLLPPELLDQCKELRSSISPCTLQSLLL